MRIKYESDDSNLKYEALVREVKHTRLDEKYGRGQLSDRELLERGEIKASRMFVVIASCVSGDAWNDGSPEHDEIAAILNRGAEIFLLQSNDGAWSMTNGEFDLGVEFDQTPELVIERTCDIAYFDQRGDKTGTQFLYIDPGLYPDDDTVRRVEMELVQAMFGRMGETYRLTFIEDENEPGLHSFYSRSEFLSQMDPTKG